ncbi:hypothetical protein FIBSPDRAFT_498060 [Athelia psychrophila]|uniref:Uncharacterized protein n=1 Tax=Athelia psychrophila TaxID=1759441 RepID=A0A166KFJ3_9AGAM|nr:hypothetical protein FIBSPDRAFT_498060 [Fibularhizoctonia sp. CBS 109695]
MEESNCRREGAYRERSSAIAWAQARLHWVYHLPRQLFLYEYTLPTHVSSATFEEGGAALCVCVGPSPAGAMGVLDIVGGYEFNI